VSASLPERLYLHVRSGAVFPEPGVAILAVSGGPDSVAMLDLFANLAPRLGLTLIVGHVDHGIHPHSSAVAESVAALASRYDLPFEAARLALGPGASETRARQARYRVLRRAQKQHGADYLLTAHHADDQLETVLMRVLKGSGPAGLAGIPPTGPRGLVRPLLPFSRQELLDHVLARDLPYFCDPANEDPRHLRSWLRVTVLPVLRERMGPLAGIGMLSLARQAKREAGAWDALLAELPGLDVRVTEGLCDVARDVLTGYDNALAERILRAAAQRGGMRLGPRTAARAVRFAARAPSGRRMDLGGGLVAEAAFERLTVSRRPAEPAEQRIQGEEGEAAFGGWQVQWRREPAPSRAALVRTSWVTWVDVADGELVVRAPHAGDRLVPLGGSGRRRVARLLMEAKVARGERGAHPVVASGEVLWVPGVCRSGARLPAPGMPSMRIEVGRRHAG
jgi:tRNA(Ile)-lysidine synthase